MFEKYDATVVGVPPGHGDGEYELQNGFGWTNGVLLDLLDKYGHVVSSNGDHVNRRTSDVYQWFVIIFVIGGVLFMTYRKCSKNRMASFLVKDLQIQRMKVAGSRRSRT